MAKIIESYNASYPAAYYKIGTVYSFYGNKNAGVIPATDEYIKHYSPALKNIDSQQKSNAIQPVGGSDIKNVSYVGFQRYYAVVVSISASSIEVMILNNDSGVEMYFTKKYAVSKSCATDGKDLMPPSLHASVPNHKDTTHKVGGITKLQSVDKEERVGGITRIEKSSKKSANIGGITKMRNQATISTNASTNENEISKSPSKVGGITRMEKK